MCNYSSNSSGVLFYIVSFSCYFFIIVFKLFINSFLLTMAAMITNKEYIKFPLNVMTFDAFIFFFLQLKKLLFLRKIVSQCFLYSTKIRDISIPYCICHKEGLLSERYKK